MKMRTMSLFESKESNGSVSLKALFDGTQDEGSKSPLSVEEISYLICRGGWPMSVSLPSEYALDVYAHT